MGGGLMHNKLSTFDWLDIGAGGAGSAVLDCFVVNLAGVKFRIELHHWYERITIDLLH